MQISPPSPISIEDLASRVRGRVVGPEDADYDSVRQVVSGEFDRRPAAIVRVQDAEDVASAVRFARETGIRFAVRCGGHSGAGHSAIDDGLVIDVRDLRSLEIDPKSRTAWAGAGLTAAEFSLAAGEHGLATGFGDTGSVGIGGITLGGGIGYLSRKHGTTVDSLLAVELVTADGEVLEASETSHPDLFWALRGGGGNFGVATRFRFRLVDVRDFVGGLLLLPATPEAIAGFLAEAAAAPDELTTIANVMPCPPMPFVPEDLHGSVIILAFMAWAGDVAEGQRALDRFRGLATPIADMTAPMAYHEIYQPEEGAGDYHPKAVAKNLFVHSIDRDAVATMVEQLEASDAPMRVVQIRVLGGAVARVPSDATAFAHRSIPIMVTVAAFYEGPDDRPAKVGWVDSLVEALRDGDDAVYVNFLGEDEGGRLGAAYPGATLDRLRAVKARYDPDNLFRSNHNITPALQATA